MHITLLSVWHWLTVELILIVESFNVVSYGFLFLNVINRCFFILVDEMKEDVRFLLLKDIFWTLANIVRRNDQIKNSA